VRPGFLTRIYATGADNAMPKIAWPDAGHRAGIGDGIVGKSGLRFASSGLRGIALSVQSMLICG
jgi:hypothetical protein